MEKTNVNRTKTGIFRNFVYIIFFDNQRRLAFHNTYPHYPQVFPQAKIPIFQEILYQYKKISTAIQAAVENIRLTEL